MNEHDLALYRQMIKERDDEIAALQMALITYGDRMRMSNAFDAKMQQAIDRAFEAFPSDAASAASGGGYNPYQP